MIDLTGPQWKLALGALYMETGRYIPAEVKEVTRSKRGGAFFGFCLADGTRCSMRIATHVGWTLDPEEQPCADQKS